MLRTVQKVVNVRKVDQWRVPGLTSSATLIALGLRAGQADARNSPRLQSLDQLVSDSRKIRL